MLSPTFPCPHGTHRLLALHERMDIDADWTGAGVVVAVIDSGFFPHPDYAQRVLIHADATEARIREGTRYRRPESYSWHGQMTTALLAGSGALSGGHYRGIAPEALLVLVKVSNRHLQIKEADILRGLEWVARNCARFGIRIVNLSVGGDFPSEDPHHPLHDIVAHLHAQGVLVVAAAGNHGSDALVPPASAPHALTVGGIDDGNQQAPEHWRPFSHNTGRDLSGGRKPELLAPATWLPAPVLPSTPTAQAAHWLAMLMRSDLDGMHAHLALHDGAAELGLSPEEAAQPDQQVIARLQAQVLAHRIVNQHYQYVEGTSTSAAIVSGVAAQMVQCNPRLTPDSLKRLLISTAQPLTAVPARQQGAGVVQPAAAVRAALAESGGSA